MKLRQQGGFTLVELIVVIVILGILAATALPRYADYGKQARIASLNGVAGAINSATAVVQGRFIALGTNATPVAMLDGTNVTVDVTSPGAGIAPSGLPTAAAAGICNAVFVQGFTCSAAGVFTITGYAPVGGLCQVAYTHVAGTTTYTVTPTTTGC